MNKLNQYSPFFDTIADESLHNTKFGIGRGHHFSVLQVKNTSHKFIVIWDEDHDTRIINVIEKMMLAQDSYLFNFRDVVAFGERKGCLSIITNSKEHDYQETSVTATSINPMYCNEYGDEWSVHINDIDMMCNGEGMLDMLKYIADIFGIDEPLSLFRKYSRIIKILAPIEQNNLTFDIID